jgi:hypothetical protein
VPSASLATFEPLPPATQWLWRGIYFVAAGVSLAVLARLWRTPRRAARR